MCFPFTSNHCIFVLSDSLTNIMLYVFVVVPSCEVISIGTVIDESLRLSLIFFVAVAVSISSSPIFIVAYLFSVI